VETGLEYDVSFNGVINERFHGRVTVVQHCELCCYLHYVDFLLINTWMDGHN